ncbi:hypothetical protein JL193_14480 [Polaribacter batillariae]|uniref:DUF5018 domain-containing protein n=1 Tax=Polaribacter batillariae TaxID=2808900 RepID=A0ABX7SUR6_9FLAO|nr:hypothetical protein [Polaribacter batillariae]QTD37296.1 hypothetical protein JL193_14480 [Polaribacter batillariae]
MRKISKISLFAIFFAVSCMQPEKIDVDVVPNLANITEVMVGSMSETGAFSPITVSLNEIDTEKHTIKMYLETFASIENVWASVRLETGCSIEPLNGSPEFGGVGNFLSSSYRVTAPSGATADWTISIEQDPNMPDISCLTDFWSGTGVNGADTIFPSYSPSTVTAVQTDCTHVTLTFEFWGSSTPEVVFELELGEPDSSDFTGSITLLNDVSFESFGYNCKYTAGPAGTYDLNTFTLNVDPVFEGYGGRTSYPFKFSKN